MMCVRGFITIRVFIDWICYFLFQISLVVTPSDEKTKKVAFSCAGQKDLIKLF